MTSPAVAAPSPQVLPDRVADAQLTEAERGHRDAVRAVVARIVAPQARRVDAEGVFPEAGVRALAQAGLGGLLSPTDLGGQGASVVSYVVAMEEIAAACGSTSTVYMTQMHCAHPIELAGTREQQRRWIPELCAATAYGALAVTEPEAGSDVAAIRTVARRDGDEYVIDGAKTFITTGDRADVIVLFATVAPEEGRRGVTAFLVEGDARGLTRGRVLKKMGLRGSSTAELFLQECRVPATALLGGERQGFDLAMRSVVNSRLSAAAQGLGYARAAFELAAGWAAASGLLEKGARAAQDTQFALAEMRAEVVAARALLHAVARLVDGPGPSPIAEVSIAKLRCTDAGIDVALAAMDLLGQEGDLAENGVERIVRDAKVAQIYDGTNQIQKMLIARDLGAALAAAEDAAR